MSCLLIVKVAQALFNSSRNTFVALLFLVVVVVVQLTAVVTSGSAIDMDMPWPWSVRLHVCVCACDLCSTKGHNGMRGEPRRYVEIVALINHLLSTHLPADCSLDSQHIPA